MSIGKKLAPLAGTPLLVAVLASSSAQLSGLPGPARASLQVIVEQIGQLGSLRSQVQAGSQITLSSVVMQYRIVIGAVLGSQGAAARAGLLRSAAADVWKPHAEGTDHGQ